MSRLSTFGESRQAASGPFSGYTLNVLVFRSHIFCNQAKKSCERRQGGEISTAALAMVSHEWRHDLRGRERKLVISAHSL